MNNTLWINTLFESFISDSNIPLYFEQKDKLNSKEPVINISIHPVRFSEDIFLNFETNDEKIREKLKKYEVNYDRFYHDADILKATYLKTVKKDNIKDNSLLLVGQTHQDKVIFDGENYLSLVDYIENIKELSKSYSHIYFKPHPYSKNNKAIFKALKKEFSNITMIYDNIYYLLSNDKIKHIVSINSSVLYEAKYFKKETTFLYKPYFDFNSTDIGIYGSYFNSSFWSDILNTDDKNISLGFLPSRLRKSLNDFWGYTEVNDEIILKDIIKSKIKHLMMKYL